MLRCICKYAAHLHLMRSVEIFSSCPGWSPNKQNPSLPRNRRHSVTLFWPLRHRARSAFYCRCSLAFASERCAVCSGVILISKLRCDARLAVFTTASGAQKLLCRRPKPRAQTGKFPSRMISLPCYANCGAAPARTPGFSRATLSGRWNRAATARHPRLSAPGRGAPGEPSRPAAYLCNHLPAKRLRHQNFERNERNSGPR